MVYMSSRCRRRHRWGYLHAEIRPGLLPLDTGHGPQQFAVSEEAQRQKPKGAETQPLTELRSRRVGIPPTG